MPYKSAIYFQILSLIISLICIGKSIHVNVELYDQYMTATGKSRAFRKKQKYVVCFGLLQNFDKVSPAANLQPPSHAQLCQSVSWIFFGLLEKSKNYFVRFGLLQNFDKV